jgi:Cu-Zn family superoxide dismutase
MDFLSSFKLAMTLAFAAGPLQAADSAAAIAPKMATCLLSPTKGSKVTGSATFTLVDGGVAISADVYGLTPGKHGFHVHEHGDCSSADGSSAGGHFNPLGTRHGGPDSAERHAGDLGNLVADASGHAHYERLDKVITLEGRNSIVGRSLVVHASSDDLISQPAGNAGGRLACGVIE